MEKSNQVELKEYMLGDNQLFRGWKEDAQQITFVVTQECNLRCKYCYMTGKNNANKMSFEVAQRAIDYFVDNKEQFFDSDYIVLDFIGGEPLLEIELIDRIIDYFKVTTYTKRSQWFGKYRINIGTNGILYSSQKVQEFIFKNKNMISVGITIDGTKEKHDMQRVYPDGSGSYEDVVKSHLLSLKQMIGSGTKVTFSHTDLPLLKDSIIHLWSLGLNDIPANVVFEDVWKDGDHIIFEKQLTELADYIINHNLWGKCNVTFFTENIGFHREESDLLQSSCGTGRMFCIDAGGDIYSCVRFMKYSLNNKPAIKYGNIYEGIDKDKMRPFKVLYEKYMDDNECIECPVNSECRYCPGYNYDMSKKDTVFYRDKAICKMHKARVRANNYYWGRLYNERGITRKSFYKQERFIYFILSDDCINFCNCTTKQVIPIKDMAAKTLLDGLRFAFYEFYQPVFIHGNNTKKMLEVMLNIPIYGQELEKEMKRHIIRHIEPFIQGMSDKNTIYIFNKHNFFNLNQNIDNSCILKINESEIPTLSEQVIYLLKYVPRVNISITFAKNFNNILEYKTQLESIATVLEDYLKNGYKKEVAQLTDKIFLKNMNNCFAGEKNITYGVDGKFYFCPAFYFDGIECDISKVD